MVERKSYTDVVRFGHPSTQFTINSGDRISITEKLDGSNMSFILKGDKIYGFSRKNSLSPELPLRGAYNWLVEHEEDFKLNLNPNYRYFGEWLVKHTIVYPEKSYNQFYGFDIFDESKQAYLKQPEVFTEFNRIKIQTVPLFYYGPYISFDHLMSYVGDTKLGGDLGEGIVVKNEKNLEINHRGPRYVKLVCEKMQEVQRQRPPKAPNEKTQTQLDMEAVITVARIEKIIYKMIDNNEIMEEDLFIENMKTLIPIVSVSLLEDIIKEENYRFQHVEKQEFKAIFGKVYPRILAIFLKQIIH